MIKITHTTSRLLKGTGMGDFLWTKFIYQKTTKNIYPFL